MHRAFHAIDAPLTAPDGRPTNALFGFFAMFGNVVSQLKPSGVIVAFDHGKPDFRYEVLEQYKLHRKPTDEKLKEQFPIVRELLGTLNVPVVRLEHWEGDDLLGTLSRQANELGIRSYLATSDKDAYQLLNELTFAVTTKPGQKSELVITTPRDVEARYGIRTDQVVDYLGLKGDPSDNIPGVMGIGEKTAAKLLQEYGTMDAAIEAAKTGTIKGSIGKKLVEGEEEAYASRQVATIVCDVPIELDVGSVEFGQFDQDKVTAAFSTLRVRSPLTKLLTLQRSYAQSKDVHTSKDIDLEESPSSTVSQVSPSSVRQASEHDVASAVDVDALLKDIEFD
ncbi:MAG: DNA polymerase I, partial [Actinomycetia bacterium]|nr:DNA polymerase I [Actinomycetes bacterium]